ncbi:unnamed protein product [Rotaria sp. Silwood2]|nr:unnamed protein product [Rotaria sp. Silwood2]
MLQVPQRHYNRRLITRHNRQNIRAISTSSLQTTISNSSTSLKRLSLPSQQKITKRTKLDITSTSSNSTSNVSMDGCTTLQNQVLFSLMCKTNCEGCGNRWSGTMDINKREDLFLILSFQCSSCTNTITIETSPKVVASNRLDINVRSQIGGHLCGIRYAGLVKLMGAMNLPSPIQDQKNSKWDKNLLLSVKSFSNRHGAAAVISCNTTPKVLDIETCNVCMGALAIKKSNSAKYNDVIRSHQCEKNYEKNFDTIEADAVLNMFKQSVSEYGVYYTKYVGDGDSKTFSLLSKTIP